MREQEGDPQLKARVRSMQRDMARKRMMAAVPRASVIVTNPGGSATSPVAVLQVIEADFGDAPEANGYPTRFVFNGAWHRIVPGVRLGNAIDFEPDGQPSATANGDDLAGSDDEDGVVFTTPLFLGGAATVAVTASTNGFLDAWIDFSANGSWMDPDEQIFAIRAVTAGVNLLTFNVPAGAVPTNTFARFRFSTAGDPCQLLQGRRCAAPLHCKWKSVGSFPSRWKHMGASGDFQADGQSNSGER